MSATFAAPPSTPATIRPICSPVSSTSGSIAGVICSAPSGIRFGGTVTVTGPATAASRSGVGASNNARTGTCSPCSRNRSTSRTASSECPPRAKKSSSGPTRSTPSTSAKIPHKISSVIVAGSRPAAAPLARCGAGSAARSSFPPGVSGSSSRTTNTDGTR